MLAGALVLGYLLAPPWRRALLSAVPLLAGVVRVAAVLAAPFLYYALTGCASRASSTPSDFVADLLNFVVPTHVEAAARAGCTQLSRHFRATTPNRACSSALPVLAIVVLFARRSLVECLGRFLLAALVLDA